AADERHGALLRPAGDDVARGKRAGGENEHQSREQETEDVKLDLHGNALFRSRRASWRPARLSGNLETPNGAGISPSRARVPQATGWSGRGRSRCPRWARAPTRARDSAPGRPAPGRWRAPA